MTKYIKYDTDEIMKCGDKRNQESSTIVINSYMPTINWALVVKHVSKDICERIDQIVPSKSQIN